MRKILLLLTVTLLLAFSSARAQVTNSGQFGGNNGFGNAANDFLNFLMPNPSNGIFQASEFNVDLSGTYSHVLTPNSAGVLEDHRQWGADLGISYFFTTGLGSRFDIQYADQRVSYTSISGIARTTFGTTNDLVMISPYFVAGAIHGVADNTTSFAGYAGFGIAYPFNFRVFKKAVHGRLHGEVDSPSSGKPNYIFGLTFDWQK